MSTTMMVSTLVGGVTDTAMGWAGVAMTDAGIRHATLFHRTRDGAAAELRAHGADFNAHHPRMEEALELLCRYAAGDDGGALDEFPVDLAPSTDFHRQAWLALREIPRGETRSYGWMARRVGHGENPRAIGAAMGANPIPLWLPCHRVIASDGKLQGFGGGLAMKRSLLELEGALPRQMM